MPSFEASILIPPPLARRRKGRGRDFDGKLEAGQERRPLGSGPRGIGLCGQEYQEAEA